MNCLEFRRQLAVDPASRAGAFLAHRADCQRCADAAERADAFEGSLRRALAVPVPDGLAERILLRQTTVRRDEGRLSAPRWLALAAGLALTVAGGLIGYRLSSEPDIASLSVGHLPHEPQSFTARGEVADAQVRQAFAKYEVQLAAAPQPVNYVHNCPVGGHRTVHMVVQRAEGPVTLLYYADRQERGRDEFAREGVMGRSVPMAKGTLVMLASQDNSFDALEQAWRGSLEGHNTVAMLGAAGGL